MCVSPSKSSSSSSPSISSFRAVLENGVRVKGDEVGCDGLAKRAGAAENAVLRAEDELAGGANLRGPGVWKSRLAQQDLPENRIH